MYLNVVSSLFLTNNERIYSTLSHLSFSCSCLQEFPPTGILPWSGGRGGGRGGAGGGAAPPPSTS